MTSLKLLNFIKDFPGLKKVIYASAGCTVAEKTFDKVTCTDEDAPVSLYHDTPYQISKIIGELYGNYYFLHYGVPFVKARFQNVYGPREILGAGQWRGTPATVWRNVIPTFIYKALAQQAEKGRSVREIQNGIQLLSQKFEGMDIAHLRNLSDRWKKETPSSIIFLANIRDRKASFIVSLSQNLLSSGLDAVVIARAAAKVLSGSAGGRPDFAQGGGAEPPDWEALLQELEKTIKQHARP